PRGRPIPTRWPLRTASSSEPIKQGTSIYPAVGEEIPAAVPARQAANCGMAVADGRRSAIMEEIQDPLEPANPFYPVRPDDLPGGRGNLIRFERLDGYAALDEASATYRIIYESTSGLGDPRWHGEPIGVSGIIAIPRKPHPGGWPVVTWAHGTVGSADK